MFFRRLFSICPLSLTCFLEIFMPYLRKNTTTNANKLMTNMMLCGGKASMKAEKDSTTRKSPQNRSPPTKNLKRKSHSRVLLPRREGYARNPNQNSKKKMKVKVKVKFSKVLKQITRKRNQRVTFPALFLSPISSIIAVPVHQEGSKATQFQISAICSVKTIHPDTKKIYHLAWKTQMKEHPPPQ